MKQTFVAIDVGTTNVKCVVSDRDMNILADASSEYKTRNSGLAMFEQDACEWWANAKSALKQALYKAGADASDVIGLAVSSQAPTMLPVDKDGNAVYPALIWMDRRSDAQCRQMSALLGEDAIYNATGNVPDPFYTFPELLWFKQNEPESYRNTRFVLQANGYINFKLTGEMTIDKTHASITQCYDVRNRAWYKEILSKFDVPVSIMPRVVDCDEVIGGVCQSAAAETGLRPGTPVLGGSVDGAAAGLEGGVFESSVAVEMSGTSSVLLAGSSDIHTSKKLTYMYGALPDQHLLLGCMSVTGGALKWYRDNMLTGVSGDAYEWMNQKIEAECPRPTRLAFLPYLAGERAPIWDTHAKGAFIGVTFDTTEADMLRAIQEGAAFAMMDNLTEVKRAGVNVDKLRAVGGSTKSDIWMKIKASVTGMPIEIPSQNLGAPGGLLALLSGKLGDHASAREACMSMLKIERVIEPVPEWVKWYEEQFEVFKAYYSGLKHAFCMADEVGRDR